MSTVQEGVSYAAVAAQDTTNQISEKVQEKKADVKYELHKNQAQDPDQPLGDRVRAGLTAAADKIEGAQHEAKGEYYKNKPNESKPNSGGIIEDVKEGVSNAAQAVTDKVNQVGENLQGKKAEAEKEIHKNQAKDSSKPVADRVKAGVNAAGDKVDEMKHDAKGEYYKNKPNDDGTNSAVGAAAGIKDGAINTLDFIGEKIQGTAQYIKGDESDRNPEGGVVQTIKEAAVATLQFVGESTQQTAEYLRGETADAHAKGEAKKAECAKDCSKDCSTETVHKDLLAEVKEDHDLKHVKTCDKSAPVIDPNAHVAIKKDTK